MPLEKIQEILNKFNKEESKIEKLLVERELIDSDISKKNLCADNKAKISFEESVKRNKQILKDLETVKGNLRSKAIFSPSEMQWEQVYKDYRDNPSLPVTTYRCHLPVYV